jgi:hypothetical protein
MPETLGAENATVKRWKSGRLKLRRHAFERIVKSLEDAPTATRELDMPLTAKINLDISPTARVIWL